MTTCVLAIPIEVAAQGEFLLGVDVFLRGYTQLVRGKRVGLLTNQSGLDSSGRTTIDLLYGHPDVRLVKLFSPEHGIRGKVKAGEHVGDQTDPQTGLPVISLYGKLGYRPKPEQIADIDVLIYDIQDVGSRAYTYIWSMGEALTACGENGVRMIVLDRPCVFGADNVDGPLCDPRYKSLLTRFPIPRVYGMTCGEIARYFNSMYRLGCHLTVIPMAGYRRGMQYEQTGLRWIAPSPNIPDLNAARCFPATGTLGELGNLHIGIGTNLPFQMVGAPWINGERMAADLNSYRLPGIQFKAFSFLSPAGAFYANRQVNGVLLSVTDPASFRPASTELALLIYLAATYPKDFSWDSERSNRFDRAMGTASVRTAVYDGQSFESIRRYWAAHHAVFDKYRRMFLIYQ